MSSALDGIRGVGEKRRNDLLKAFKTISAIREATVDQLNLVVPRDAAQAVYYHFHNKDEREEEQV